MSELNNLAGKKFGSWLVLKLTKSYKLNSSKQTYWLCRCKCGKEKEINSYSLNIGKSKSCNTGLCNGRAKDLRGKKFNRWTVGEIEIIKNNSIYWNVKCECGNKKILKTQEILNGCSKSCGCYQKERLSETIRKEEKEVCINILWNRYIHGAKSRNLDFILNKNEFTNLISTNCYYCNSFPNLKVNKREYTLFYNGIDRIDNSKGYILENCVSCCSDCNYLKADITLDLIIKIHKIASDRKIIIL